MLLLSNSMHLSCRSAEEAEEDPVHPSEMKYLLEKAERENGEREFKKAFSTYKEALALADKEKAPKQWCNIAIFAASMHGFMGEWEQAEALSKEVLRLREKIHGEDAPETIAAINALAQVYLETKHAAEAEPLLRRSLRMTETTYGEESPQFAVRLQHLGMALADMGNMKEAEDLVQRALVIDEATSGKDAHEAGATIGSLGSLYYRTNHLAKAEPLLRKALAIGEEAYGNDNPRLIVSLNNLGCVLTV